MIITNKFNYPKTLVDAVSFDAHRTEGDISVTTLIGAPQVRYLRKKHSLEQTEDVSNLIFSLFGTAIHSVLERANMSSVRRGAFMEVINALKEHHSRHLNGALHANETEQEALDCERVFKWLLKYMFKFYPELESKYLFELTLKYECNGWVISGTLDLYDKIEKVLYDYKVTTVYSYMNPESRLSWIQQLNIYTKFLRHNGYEVKAANVIAIFRDFSKAKAYTNRGYPKRQVMEIPITLYRDDLMTKWIDDRIKLHQAADNGVVPECTGAERWSSSPSYAVLQDGRKTALPGSVTDSKDAAQMYITNNQHKYKKPLTLRVTEGVSRKCEQYCNVNEFCEQYKKIKAANVQPDDFTSV